MTSRIASSSVMTSAAQAATNLSQAVPDHCVRRDAPGFHKLGQGIFDRKQRRLRVIGAVDQRVIAVLGKNHLEQAALKMRLRQAHDSDPWHSEKRSACDTAARPCRHAAIPDRKT